MKAILIAIAITVIPAGAFAQNVTGIKKGRSGTFRAEILEKVEEKGSAAGYRSDSKVAFLSEGTVLNAKQGIAFGFEYKIIGIPKAVSIPLKAVVIYPKQGLTNPRTHQTKYSDSFVVPRSIEEDHVSYYKLSEPWEVQPGRWTFELWYQNRKLTEQSFDLIK